MAEQIYTNCTVCGPVHVHVENGRITRIRPLQLDDSDPKDWTIEARGYKFTPPRKVTVGQPTMTERDRVYAEDRIKYPMIREDFNPNGARNPQNRGKSGYRRISWDEALDIVASEIKRVQSVYGKEALSAMTSSHHCWGLVGYKASAFKRFFSFTGYTQVLDNPDSWEGFHWGATHTYGYWWRLGAPEPYDLLEDCLKHTDMIVHWANDPDTIRGGYAGQESAIWRVWMRKLGIKMVYIDPFCNFTAVKDAYKWLAPRPGTEAALAEAIAYVWITEGTYDKDFVARKTHGFEEFKAYILGLTDGKPKDPAYAAELTELPEATIKALAREWASHRTMLACGARGGFGGAMRTAYGHEWARLMVLLAAMQGMGRPGSNFWGAVLGAPCNTEFVFPGYADKAGNIASPAIAKIVPVNPVKQKLYRLLLPKAFTDPPVSWMGEGFCGESLEQQFTPFRYPMAGHSEVKMFYRYGGSFFGTMCETNDYIAMYQSPRLECVVGQDIWWTPEMRFADIVLPACTNLERYDIAEASSSGGYSQHASSGCNRRICVMQKKCIEPLYESKSDYQIFTELADRLGFKDKYTEGLDELGWCRRFFEFSDASKYISWEEFYKKGYFVVPMPENYKPTPAYRWFYEDRVCDTPDPAPKKTNTLHTYTGKIEFVSESLKHFTPDDTERGPMPRYQDSWEGHKSELYKKYPFHMISPHPRYGYHTHYDAHAKWLWEIPEHRVLKDGHPYIVVRINPENAKAKGIQEGDIVKLFNDRGVVLGIARITERVRRNVVHVYTSSGIYKPLEPGKPSPDMGGCVNILTSKRFMSKKVAGFAPNSCLIDIEKWEGQ